MPAPINVLQNVLLINAEDIVDLAGIQNKYLAALYKADRCLPHGRSQGRHHNQDQTPAQPCRQTKRRFHDTISASNSRSMGTPARSSARRLHCFRWWDDNTSLSLRAMASARSSGLPVHGSSATV